jgi:hypothetical protein
MTITAKRLEELGACLSQIDNFRAIWGDGPAPMTVEAAVEHAEAFYWEQAARKLLKPSALAQFRRAEALALGDHERAATSDWTEYHRARARAFAEAYIKQEAA